MAYLLSTHPPTHPTHLLSLYKKQMVHVTPFVEMFRNSAPYISMHRHPPTHPPSLLIQKTDGARDPFCGDVP